MTLELFSEKTQQSGKPKLTEDERFVAKKTLKRSCQTLVSLPFQFHGRQQKQGIKINKKINNMKKMVILKRLIAELSKTKQTCPPIRDVALV